MNQSEYIVTVNECIAPGIWKMRLEGDTSALRRAGQFVNLAVGTRFLRRPFAVFEWDAGSFSIVYKTVGEGTAELSSYLPGCRIDCLTGLGNGFDASACRNAALVVCGGLGASPAYSLVRELVASGRKVTVIMGFNTDSDIVLYDEYCSLGADVRIVTADGSAGIKGLVTDALGLLRPEYDYFYTCGPKVMMRAVCEMLDGPGEASLEERMGCGCGICYGCTCHTRKGPARVCADGPVFRKEDIIW